MTAHTLPPSGQPQLLLDYTTPANPQLETMAILAADGPYVGVATFGNDGDVPTALLFAVDPTGQAPPATAPIFSYTTPGSMFAVDVVYTHTNATADAVLLAVAGKHVAASRVGNGGDAYAWAVVASKA